jgi:hypothetical protein
LFSFLIVFRGKDSKYVKEIFFFWRKEMSITLKIFVASADQTKAMSFTPTMSVSEVCGIIAEKVGEEIRRGGGRGCEQFEIFFIMYLKLSIHCPSNSICQFERYIMKPNAEKVIWTSSRRISSRMWEWGIMQGVG